MVDAALARLAERGRLKPIPGQATNPAGQPLLGATIDRYVSTLCGVFRCARRLRLLPRAHVPPTRGIERAGSPPDPERYFRPEEVERRIAVAELLDVRWGL